MEWVNGTNCLLEAGSDVKCGWDVSHCGVTPPPCRVRCLPSCSLPEKQLCSQEYEGQRGLRDHLGLPLLSTGGETFYRRGATPGHPAWGRGLETAWPAVPCSGLANTNVAVNAFSLLWGFF